VHYIGILVTLVIVGLVWAAFDKLVGKNLEPNIRWVIYVVACVILFLWLLCAFGLYCYKGPGG
jgi:hypothetical protein